MILCQFIFKPGTYDDEFYKLDGEIEVYAEALEGYVGVERWVAPEGGVKNSCYYFESMDAVRELAAYPQHRVAKQEQSRWYDGYQIVVSEVTASYGDGRIAHVSTKNG